MGKIVLKYDGRWDWFPTKENRQWTLLSHWTDAKGHDRIHGSFDLDGLRRIGVVK